MKKVKKNRILLIVISVTCVLLFSIALCGIMNTRVIHYQTGSLVYDIKVKKYNLYVKISEQPQCIKAPCDMVVTDSFVVKYKKEYHILIDNLFKDSNTKEITVTEGQLSNSDLNILSEIIIPNK